MNILVLNSAPPTNVCNGCTLIAREIFSRLRQHRLTLLCPGRTSEAKDHHSCELFDAIHIVPRENQLRALAGVLETRLARTAASRAFQQTLTRLLSRERFDVIHARGLPMAALASSTPHPAWLLELVDSHTLQARRDARLTAPATWLRYPVARFVEASTLRHVDVCTTVADADARAVRKLAPSLPVHVIPNGVDSTYFAPMNMPELPGTILFSGVMSYSPNVSAVQHFYKNIFPLVRRDVPRAQFIIAGRDPSPLVTALAADPQVKVTGAVDDLRPWMSRSSVVVCPMISGSGIKNKMLEALAMGRPVVSTSLGAEALPLHDGLQLRIADRPRDFAAAILQLFRIPKLRQAMGQAGRDYVLQNHTWEACSARYDALYRQLAQSGPSLASLPLGDVAA